MLHDTTAEAIGHLILAQHGCGPLHITLLGGGENDALFCGHEVFELIDERRDGTVETERRPGVDGDLAERRVFVKHVDGA